MVRTKKKMKKKNKKAMTYKKNSEQKLEKNVACVKKSDIWNTLFDVSCMTDDTSNYTVRYFKTSKKCFC